MSKLRGVLRDRYMREEENCTSNNDRAEGYIGEEKKCNERITTEEQEKLRHWARI